MKGYVLALVVLVSCVSSGSSDTVTVENSDPEMRVIRHSGHGRLIELKFHDGTRCFVSEVHKFGAWRPIHTECLCSRGDGE